MTPDSSWADCPLNLLGSPASWAHHLPLHSHGKNDDHLSDGDRGKGSQRTQDDNVCVRHQPRQIPIFSFLVSFLSFPSPFIPSFLPPPLSSLFFCTSTKGGKWALCGTNEALLQGQCDPRSPQLDFSLTISWDEIQAMPRWTASLIGSCHSTPSFGVSLFSVGRPHSKLRSVQSFFPFPNLVATLK